jgi:hypothetical protein
MLTITLSGCIGSVTAPRDASKVLELTILVVPIVFSGLFGLGNILCFGGILQVSPKTWQLWVELKLTMLTSTFLVECVRKLHPPRSVCAVPAWTNRGSNFMKYPLYAASALAANSFVRCVNQWAKG